MKAFKAPVVEIVYFDQKDIIVTSLCVCVECTTCTEGKDDCACYDFPASNQ